MITMNMKIIWLIASITIFGTGVAQAQDQSAGDEEEQTTIRLMGAADAELPDAVVKEIVLPENAADEAALNAADGLLKAEERHDRRENGLSTADEARDNASDMADDALDNVENRGRADDLPDGVPGRPEMPELPEVH
jgi:hypothetical protein